MLQCKMGFLILFTEHSIIFKIKKKILDQLLTGPLLIKTTLLAMFVLCRLEQQATCKRFFLK